MIHKLWISSPQEEVENGCEDGSEAFEASYGFQYAPISKYIFPRSS